jgi:hypothetical protein
VLCVSVSCLRLPDELQDLTTTIDVDELSSRIISAGQVLLKHFVGMHGDRLGTMVRKSMLTGDWMKRKEPRDSRPVVDAVIEEVRGGWGVGGYEVFHR